MMKQLLKTYMKDIAATIKRGDAREESYYGFLANLLEAFPLEKGRKTKITTLPKKTDAGNPDFRVWDGDHFIVGYIEAKTPGIISTLLQPLKRPSKSRRKSTLSIPKSRRI